MQQIELWGFLSGLGLFMLGMFMLEQGLRGIGSRSMKKFLREQTKSPLRGVVTGTIGTFILQSSSLVSLIVLAFVGAGIFELRNALGIILGCNLGTTFKGWLVTLIGFKLNLDAYAAPMLALGAIGTVFLEQNSKRFYLSNLVLGLGLLLMGLVTMTQAFSELSNNIDVSVLQGHNILVYFIAGTLFTAVIQSSSASMMILLSAIHTDVITLHEALPLAIGADLGTTSTVLLGAMVGSDEKRRVALSHFFFNLVTDVIALLAMPLMIYFIIDMLRITDPMYALVAFHSLFNTVGIMIFLPIVDQFIKFLRWLVPVSKAEVCAHIKKVPAKVTDAAIAAIHTDLTDIFTRALRINLHCFKIPVNSISTDPIFAAQDHLSYDDEYALLKRGSGELLGYTYEVQMQTLDEADVRELNKLNHAIRNVNYAAKYIKDIRHNLLDFRHDTTPAIEHAYNQFHNEVKFIYRKLAELLLNRNPELAQENYEQLKTDLRKSYEQLMHEIYRASGEDRMDDEETSNLQNVNRAIYLSCMALLESVLELLPETPSEPESRPEEAA